MNIVIAGNHREFEYWIHEHGHDPKYYTYVEDANKLRGLHNCTIITVGRFWTSPIYDHPDIKYLLARIQEN